MMFCWGTDCEALKFFVESVISVAGYMAWCWWWFAWGCGDIICWFAGDIVCWFAGDIICCGDRSCWSGDKCCCVASCGDKSWWFCRIFCCCIGRACCCCCCIGCWAMWSQLLAGGMATFCSCCCCMGDIWFMSCARGCDGIWGTCWSCW